MLIACQFAPLLPAFLPALPCKDDHKPPVLSWVAALRSGEAEQNLEKNMIAVKSKTALHIPVPAAGPEVIEMTELLADGPVAFTPAPKKGKKKKKKNKASAQKTAKPKASFKRATPKKKKNGESSSSAGLGGSSSSAGPELLATPKPNKKRANSSPAAAVLEPAVAAAAAPEPVAADQVAYTPEHVPQLNGWVIIKRRRHTGNKVGTWYKEYVDANKKIYKSRKAALAAGWETP